MKYRPRTGSPRWFRGSWNSNCDLIMDLIRLVNGESVHEDFEFLFE